MNLRTRLQLGFQFLIILNLLSCIHADAGGPKFGVNPLRTGFVPAKIAIISCISWPDRATKVKNLPFINRPMKELNTLCEEFDKVVVEGFDNQPFMKGLSPKLVEKLYGASGMTPSIFESINRELKALSTDCQDCLNLPSFYTSSIQTRQSWQTWLSKFSASTKGADALLLPIVVSLSSRHGDNRGMLESIRSGSIAMLLIDTNDGSLIWSGGREAEVIFRSLRSTESEATLKEPALEDLKRRLFTDAIWLDFPGRQIYR